MGEVTAAVSGILERLAFAATVAVPAILGIVAFVLILQARRRAHREDLEPRAINGRS